MTHKEHVEAAIQQILQEAAQLEMDRGEDMEDDLTQDADDKEVVDPLGEGDEDEDEEQGARGAYRADTRMFDALFNEFPLLLKMQCKMISRARVKMYLCWTSGHC